MPHQPQFCPRCGAAYEPLQEYCLECGARLPANRGAHRRARGRLAAPPSVVPRRLDLAGARVPRGRAPRHRGRGRRRLLERPRDDDRRAADRHPRAGPPADGSAGHDGPGTLPRPPARPSPRARCRRPPGRPPRGRRRRRRRRQPSPRGPGPRPATPTCWNLCPSRWAGGAAERGARTAKRAGLPRAGVLVSSAYGASTPATTWSSRACTAPRPRPSPALPRPTRAGFRTPTWPA